MKYISESSESSDVSLVGGKGSHLQKLVSWKAPVAPFFVLTTESFRYYRERGQLPPEVENRFEEFFKDTSEIALRSSMIYEDHADASFAGMFETVLGVKKETWRESLIRIYDSVTADRVKEYLRRKNLSVDLLMAVVAQELVKVQKSGVLFTRSPVEPTAAIAIDAAYGMGEGVVSGHADVDHYQLTRTLDLTLTRSQNEVPVLSFEEMKSLCQMGLKLEKQLGAPGDIEWGIRNGELYIFQIRPITRNFEPLTYLVDTNLSESYPGTVSPFTAGFVIKAYENVFKESAIILGAKGKRLETLCFHYEKLLTCVDDHLYYNLEHYYAVLRALPGGEKNISNWHRMIGGKMEGHSIPFHNTVLSHSETLATLGHMISLGLRRKSVFKKFLGELDQLKDSIETDQNKLYSSKDTILYLNRLINRPLGFGLTVVNDVFIMTGLGILTKALKKKGINEDEVIDLLKTHSDVDSVKPLEHFNKLVASLRPEFIAAFGAQDLTPGHDPFKNIFANLKEQGYQKESEELELFLRLYGDRSFEELKLESLPIKNNPQLLNQLLQWGKDNKSIQHESTRKKEKIALGWAEEKVAVFTRDSIANREATRLWRGKFYHLLRQLILKLGLQLRSEDETWKAFSILDFFSLSHEEWLSFAEGRLSREEAQGLISSRRKWQTKKKLYPEVIPWTKHEALPIFNVQVSAGSLEGQGVSPGVMEATALVLDTPDQALSSNLKDFILVTKNTDPAWVYIMSRSKGLISEKGSLLSHTAIIGRELNIPTIVGVKMATQILKTGDLIRIDATTGKIEKL